MAIRSHTSFKHLICFAHILNLVVQNGVKIVKPLQEKVKAIVEHFCRSTVATDKLQSETDEATQRSPEAEE